MDETKKFEQLAEETGLTVEWLREQRSLYPWSDWCMSFEMFAELVKSAKILADCTLPEER